MKMISTHKLLPYLVAALVATLMVALGESAYICEELADLHGKCEADCRIWCLERHEDGRSKCDKNVCYCYWQCHDNNNNNEKSSNSNSNSNNNVQVQVKKCNIGLGRCNDGKCDAKCCVTKCANQLLEGVGFCDTSLGPHNGMCQCQYTCFP